MSATGATLQAPLAISGDERHRLAGLVDQFPIVATETLSRLVAQALAIVAIQKPPRCANNRGHKNTSDHGQRERLHALKIRTCPDYHGARDPYGIPSPQSRMAPAREQASADWVQLDR
jgi:hypothetical protein